MPYISIAYVIGICLLPRPKFFSLLKYFNLKWASSYFAFPHMSLGLIYLSFLVARLSGTCLLMSACCNSVNKSNLQFSGHTFFYKQSVGDLTLAQFLKHVIIPQNGRFSTTSIRKLLIGGFRKKRNCSKTSTGAQPERKMRFISGELFDT